MASIKDAFEESFHANNATLKYIIFAIPLYYCLDKYLNGTNPALFWGLTFLLYLFYFGFLLECTANVRNSKERVLPSFNIFKTIWAGFKGSVALGPSIAINSILAAIVYKFAANYVNDPTTLNVYKFLISGLFSSFILTGYLCYAKEFKISDAYNLKVIYNTSVDVFIAVLFMIPQIWLANAILIAPVTYIIWIFFGIPHPIATFYWCMVFVFNLALCGHYLAQIGYEAIGTKENKDKIL